MRAILGLVAAFLLGAVVTGLPLSQAAFSGNGASMALLRDVMERVQDNYVEQVEREALIRSAVDGMVSDLDPHSDYLTPDQFESMKVSTKGQYGGLGLRVTEQEDGFIRVISPIEGTPAAAKDIRAGDLIVGVAGTPARELDLSDAVKKMRGEPGSDITITLRRDGGETFEVTLRRERITIEPVRTDTFGKVGYLRITRFNQQTGDAVAEALETLQEDATEGALTGIVLDLRNNPGGLLEQAIKVADLFLADQEIVSVRGRAGEVARSYAGKAGRAIGGEVPIVVLINAGSASASEIVAGALRDHERAIVLGTRSFGKGSVQTVQPLDGGGALRLTTARYYTPSGDSIQAQGIVPDIRVAQARVKPQETAREMREADLPRALSGDSAGQDGEGDGDGAESDETPANADATKLQDDYQLTRAVSLLRGLALMRQGG